MYGAILALLFLTSNAHAATPDKRTSIILVTSKGNMVCELFHSKAPKACENFIALAKRGYYNNTSFHRVIPGFMCQGGDPTGTGAGGNSMWNKPFRDEFHKTLSFSKKGLLAMANKGPNTNTSQFFITTAKTPWLNNKHTIFGRVVKGFNVLDAIEKCGTQSGKPKEKILIQNIILPALKASISK
ncbi:peptidylprolyl isomerase [Candidatus Aerophobetes bacterium]|uniref:Peptidyl-prolyl cis-trans isomerase n=1 Tax=Aerophobetes bacterium TaxID=2030807 RepID=A0A2A4X588_UNCAE|nr:MAG: peptidylprolyl isomerase [Candidatus Aerophobetes bacterium]